MIELTGNYLLKIEFGELAVPLQKDTLQQLTIKSDINSLVPEFNMLLSDPQGILTHIMPMDKSMTRIKIQIGKSISSTVYNTYNFLVYKINPINKFGTSMVYEISGLLDIQNMFKQYKRAFKQNISATINTIAEEFVVDKVEIGSGLNYEYLLLQPMQSNINFLNNLKRILIGSNNEYAYQLFIKQTNGFSTLVCKSLEELINDKPKYKFIVDERAYNDFYPIFSYEILDKYRIFGNLGAKKQKYSYYDFLNSEYITDEKNYDDFLSSSFYLMIDNEDDENSNEKFKGRNHEYNLDYSGNILAPYYKRLNNMVRMSITTWGIENISPGDMIEIFFPQGGKSGSLFSYQYGGYWMVERVINTFDDTSRTKLLLTRPGLDTDKDTSLIPAIRRKK